jgi:hypothetical protein
MSSSCRLAQPGDARDLSHQSAFRPSQARDEIERLTMAFEPLAGQQHQASAQ